MKLKFRKALSLLCAISMLLTSIPFLVISEESIDGNDVPENLPEQVELTAEEENIPSEEGSEGTVPDEVPAADDPAAEEPEQAVAAEPENTVQDEIPSEPEVPAQEEINQVEAVAEDQSGEETNGSELSQEDTGRIPDFEPEEPAGIVMEFESEQAQAIDQVELAVTTQTVEEQNIPETKQEETTETKENETQEIPETKQEETTETTTGNDAQQNQDEEAKENRVNEAEQTNEESGTEQPLVNQQDENAGAEQGNDKQQAQEGSQKDEENETSETIQEQNDDETNVTSENDDVTVSDETWADYVTNVKLDDPDVTVWSVTGDLEAGKETVIRIISSTDTNLYFLLSSDTELDAALTDENNENWTTFDIYENETDTKPLEYYLRAVHFIEDGSQLIHILPAADGSFDLQVMTGTAWALLQEKAEAPVAEAVPETAETEEGDPAEATDESAEESTETETNEGEAEPEEILEVDEDTLVRYNGDEVNVIIPDGITEIGSHAFSGNETIQTVTLPDSVELINNAAFADCVNLQQVILSENSQLITIGNGAFRNDTKLDISFANDVPNILSNAFEGIGNNAEEETVAEKEESEENEETEEFAASEETEENEEETVNNQLIFEGEDFTITVTFADEAQLPEGTELTALEILPETVEYEAYFSLSDEERSAIWNAVAEEGRLFLITFLCNGEEVTPSAPIEVQVVLHEPEILWTESPMVFEGEDFTVTVSFGEDVQFPAGTELTVREILPESEEYEVYFTLTEEERSAIWNMVAEGDRLFLIAFMFNEEEIAPQSSIDVKIELAEPEVVYLEAGQMIFEGEDFTVTVSFGDDALFPEGTVLNVREILPETEEYETYFSLTDEERSAVWNLIAEDGRLFLISFLCNETEIIPQASVDVKIELAEVYLEAGQMTFEGEDFTVTVSFGDDALFPVGTELNVREILPDTPEYTLYSGMTDEALNEDWAEITLERYFDIAFMANGEEMEPKGFVDVQITFHEKIEQNEETEVQAVHIENNEANVIEVETDSTKVAIQDDEAIDTVAFSSDSFSVYGVVQKKKIITKTLVDGGNTYEIEITYNQEAGIPENAEVKVEEIPEGSELWDAYRKQTAAALNAFDVQLPGLYDISIVDEAGVKVLPQAPVSVAFKMIREDIISQDLQVVHFKEEIPQELVENDGSQEEEFSDKEVENPVEQTEVWQMNDAATQTIESEQIIATVEDDTVTFDTQGFSVYAFAYTVDFYYEANGETVEYHIPGGSVQSLRELVHILKIVEDDPETETSEADAFINYIDNVSFSDESLVKPVRVYENTTAGIIIDSLDEEIVYAGDLTENDINEMRAEMITAPDWALVSLKPFLSEELLTITLKNGQVITIIVTDAQDPSVFQGKQVIIYDNGEQRAMTANWEKSAYRTQLWTIPLDGADYNERARWTVEYINNAYYFKSYDGKYLKIDSNDINLVELQSDATSFNIQAGTNPDYRIYDNNNYNNVLTYCNNTEFDGFFSAPGGANYGDKQVWLYIKEANVLANKFSVDVATWTSWGNRWGRLGSKYYGIDSNGNGIAGDRYPASGTTAGVLDNYITRFQYGFGTSPNDGYQFAFWTYQENGLYRQLNNITYSTEIPFDPTEYLAYFTPLGKKLFIYQSEDTNKGTVDQTYGYSDWTTGATATPKEGYAFYGWFSDDNRLISTDKTFSFNSASKSMVLTAKFTPAQQVSINISVNYVDDQPAGDVVVSSNGQETSYCGQQYTGNDGKLHRTITAKPLMDGYEFYYWTLNGNRMPITNPVLSYDESIAPAPVFKEGDQLQAVFLKSTTIDADGNAYSTIHVGNDKQQEFQRWINALTNNETLDADKTAKVSDYNDRIYQIDINAKSVRVKPDANIGIAFILDASGSMRFPANLEKTDITMVLTQDNLNREFPNESGPLYFISDPTQTSTVYRLYKEDGLWYAVDASYYDAATVLNSRYYVEWNAYYTDWANSDKVPLAYPIYRDVGNGTQRIEYLNQGLNGTVNTLHNIVDQVSQISGSNYDIKVAYTMFAAYTKKQHKDGDTPKSGFDWVDFTSLKNYTNFTVSMTDTDGGTRQDLGLYDALAFNWDSITEGQRYAILITDGAAVIGGSGTTWDGKNYQGVQDNITAQANALKAKGVTLITVGLSTQNVVGGSNVMSVIASPYNGNNTLFFEAGNGNDLQNIMYEIVQTVVKNGTSCGQVVDEVDEAFYPVKDDGTPVEAGYYNSQGQKISLEEYNALAPWNSRYKWENTNGKWKITWENQYIGWNPVASDSRMQPWNGTFYVKAKEDFLGGNTISTNSGECKVIEDGYTYDDVLTTDVGHWTILGNNKPEADLPVPHVNVDELAFTGNHTEWTVYLGTEVDPLPQLKNLYSKIDILKVVSGSTNEMITDKNQMLGGKSETQSQRFSLSSIIPMSDEEWTSLISGNTVTKQYSKYGHDIVGIIQISLTKNHEVNSHITETVGTSVEQYTLNVTYIPTEESEPTGGWHTTAGGQHGVVTNNMATNNEHKINVFAKGLKIEKKDTKKNIITNGTAKFMLYRKPKDGETQTVKLTIGENEIDVVPIEGERSTSQGVLEINSLPYATDGIYYLVETEAPEGYGMISTPIEIQINLANSYWAWNQTKNNNSVSTLSEDIKPYNWEQTASITCNGENTTEVDASKGLYGISVINPRTVSLNLKKEVLVNGVAPAAGKASLTDGYYEFTVSGVNEYSSIVRIIIYKGQMSGAQVKVGEEWKDVDPTPDDNIPDMAYSADNGLTISKLMPGAYNIQETGWQLTNLNLSSNAAGMYLQQIDIPTGNTSNLTDRTATVNLVEDETSTVLVKFTNALYQTSLQIIKDNVNDPSKRLSGAVFELRRKNGTEYIAVTDGSVGNVNENGQFTVNQEITLTGIADGDYRIVEISAPDGYLKYDGEIDFTIINGEVETPNVDESIIRYHAKKVENNVTTDPEFLIGNTPAVVLPSTGGPGTMSYTIAGLVLILLAGGWLANSKRRTAREHK